MRTFINSGRYKRLFAIIHDLIMILVSYFLATILRFDLSFQPEQIADYYKSFAIIFIIKAITFQLFGLYRGIWRFSSTPDLIRIVQSVSFSTLLSAFVLFLLTRLYGFPRTIFIIDWFVLITLLGGSRFAYRLWKDGRLPKFNEINKENALIIGAGHAGEKLCRDIIRTPQLGLNVVGFIDDDKSKIGRTIMGIKVKGTTEALDKIAKSLDVHKIFIALPSAKNSELRRIVDQCLKTNIDFKTLPSNNHLIGKDINYEQLRHVKAEDLLGREPINFDISEVKKLIQNKTIMITGAGGSIGSELCRQIASWGPSRIILFEICELFLFNLENELQKLFPFIELSAVIGDIRNFDRVQSVFEMYHIDLVFHAAAYKHVPMMEKNPYESISTNIKGTNTIAELAGLYKVQKFVMISTDKAVNPTNIMGTTKRVAEMICTKKQKCFPSTQYITVRFGNVLGSNGSVIPLFRSQIENGGPVTVTHPKIERFFMSIPEASLLVLQASTIGTGGEIFVLDMGEPVKIVDLAKDMINLAGLRPDIDIKIQFTGLRPGEKFYEELFDQDENIEQTSHPKVRKSNVRPLPESYDETLGKLLVLPPTDHINEVKNLLRQIVPEYTDPKEE